MSQLEENYTWAFCEHAGTSAYVHRSDLEAIRNSGDPTSKRSSYTRRHDLFQRFCKEVQYRKEGVSSKTNNTLLAYQSPLILLGTLHQQSMRTNSLQTHVKSLQKRLKKYINKTKRLKGGANINWEVLFNKTDLQAAYNKLISKKEVTERRIFSIIYSENVLLSVHALNIRAL